MTALCLHCWAQSFSIGTKWGLLLLGWASQCMVLPLLEHGHEEQGLPSNFEFVGSKAQAWDYGTLNSCPMACGFFLGQGSNQVACFLTPGPPRKPLGGASNYSLNDCYLYRCFQYPRPCVNPYSASIPFNPYNDLNLALMPSLSKA